MYLPDVLETGWYVCPPFCLSSETIESVFEQEFTEFKEFMDYVIPASFLQVVVEPTEPHKTPTKGVGP